MGQFCNLKPCVRFHLAVFLSSLCFALWVQGAASQDPMARWTALNTETIALFQQDRLDEAEQSARATVSFANQALSPTSTELGSSYNNLGTILHRLGKFAEARIAHETALWIRQSVVPLNQGDVATSLTSIADAYFEMRNYDQAAPFYRRAVGALDRAQLDAFFAMRGLAYALYFDDNANKNETSEALDAMVRVAGLYGTAWDTNLDAYIADLEAAITLARESGRSGEIVKIAQELIRVREGAAEPDQSAVAWAYRYLAESHQANKDYAAARHAYDRAIEQASTDDGPVNQDVATFSYILGDMLADVGRFAEAERAFRQTLTIERTLYGDAHHETINSYNRLGLLLFDTGRSAAAERVLRRGLELAYQVHGPDSLWVATVSDNLGLALSDTGKLSEAITLHRRALALRENALGRLDSDTSKTINNLALALEKDGQFEPAQALFREALAIDRETLPEGSWEIGIALTNLGSSLAAMNTVTASAEAYFHYREALEISRANYPSSHPDVAGSLDSLAIMANRAARYDEAVAYLREAAAIYSAPQNRDSLADRGAVFDAAAVSLLAVSQTNAAEAFELAQWPMQTAASKAIAASAQRAAVQDRELSGLVRGLQDLQSQNADLNRQVLASLVSDDEGLRNRLRVELEQTEQQIALHQSEMASRFPDFAQLQAGVPVSVSALAAVLDPDEALVFIRPGHERNERDSLAGSIFVVRAGGSVVTAPLESGYTLQEDAQVLLCSVHGGVSGCPPSSEVANATRGVFSLDATPQDDQADQAFNVALAHDLYRRLFGGVEAELKSVRRLIIIPGDETLAALPFQLLISEVPELFQADEAAVYRNARWLVRDWAITVLPNVSSLTHARQKSRTPDRRVETKFLGIGDPVIGAATSINCASENPLQLAALDRAVLATGTSELWRSAAQDGNAPIADVAAVRRLSRLPDTRCELEQIAQSIGNGDLLLAENANETRLKAMSQQGQLKQYDVISFATHGLVAGEIANAEPALVLTPPDAGSERDDGLLTAHEIAQLELNAEWVLLSACNTAGGRITAGDGSVQSESFSGLARAFFYAGARNLLVSHWPVQSPAAVRLTTTTFQSMAQDQNLDRATAFQRAMLTILNDPDSGAAVLHPRYWAPFTLLGDSR